MNECRFIMDLPYLFAHRKSSNQFSQHQSHGLGQLSITRPAPECKSRNNVLYVGASTRPGNGVPVSDSLKVFIK